MENVIILGKRLLPVEQIAPGRAVRCFDQSRLQVREGIQGARRAAQSGHPTYGIDAAGVCNGARLSDAHRRQCRGQSVDCLQRRKAQARHCHAQAGCACEIRQPVHLRQHPWPRVVKPSDGINLNVAFEGGVVTNQIAESLMATLVDGNALYKSVEETKAAYRR
jgi:hypothetical protein